MGRAARVSRHCSASSPAACLISGQSQICSTTVHRLGECCKGLACTCKANHVSFLAAQICLKLEQLKQSFGIREHGACACACRGLLKSGLGRFGLVQKQPQPGDHSTVIIFVVGGISVADLREVRHVVAEKITGQPGRASVKVLVGGTALMSPHDIVDGLLN